MQLGAEREGGRAARLEGLCGGTRVSEVLRLAAEALGVPGGAAVVLRLGSGARLLRGEETLAEAGVEAGAGGEVEVRMEVGRDGGGLLRYLGRMIGRQSAAVLAGGPGDVVTGPGYSLHAMLGYPLAAPDAAADDSVSIFASRSQTNEGLVEEAVGLLREMEGDVLGIEDAVTRLNAASPAPAQVIDMLSACRGVCGCAELARARCPYSDGRMVCQIRPPRILRAGARGAPRI